PVAAFDDRGVQRLHLIMLGVPLTAVNGEIGFAIARALICLAFASAAVPAYKIARGIRLGRGWALLAAALCIAVPWAALTMTFLSEPLAYAMALWAVYGAWRACVVPGLASDVFAVVLAAAATLARTNLVVLVALAPATVALVTAARAAHDPEPGRAARAVRRLLRENPLLTLLFVGCVALLVLNVLGLQPGFVDAVTGG